MPVRLRSQGAIHYQLVGETNLSVHLEEDPATDMFKAYTIDSIGEIVEADSITSEYAYNHEVWVISLNERVDNQGVLDLEYGNFTDSTFLDKPMGFVNARINNMTVLHHKESKLAGKSEVSVKTILVTWNGRLDGLSTSPGADYFSDTYDSDFSGKLIKDFKRNDIKNQVQRTVNYNLHRNWVNTNYYFHPIGMTYVIFERDKWPTGVKTTAVIIVSSNETGSTDPNKRILTFRSADYEYSKGIIYNTNYTSLQSALPGQEVGRSNNFSVSNGSIIFNVHEY